MAQAIDASGKLWLIRKIKHPLLGPVGLFRIYASVSVSHANAHRAM